MRRALFIIATLAAVLLVSIAWVHILRRRVRHRTLQLQTAMDRLRREAEISATLSERNRLAGEIHDSLEQGFSALMLQLDAALRLPGCTPDMGESLGIARRMASFSRSEVRNAVLDLHSPVLEESDLRTALALIAQPFSSGSPRVTVATTGDARPLPSAVEHHLLRVAQEAVTNAVKHAGATTISVTLAYTDEAAVLTIRDDGLGFEPAAVLSGTNVHFGLRSLRTRAKRINGRLAVTSRPGEGTVVKLVVPLESMAESNRPVL